MQMKPKAISALLVLHQLIKAQTMLLEPYYTQATNPLAPTLVMVLPWSGESLQVVLEVL